MKTPWIWLVVVAAIAFSFFQFGQKTPVVDEAALIQSQNLELYQQVLLQINPFPGVVLQQVEVSNDFHKILILGKAQRPRLKQYFQKTRIYFPQTKVLKPVSGNFQIQISATPQLILSRKSSHEPQTLSKNETKLTLGDLIKNSAAHWCEVSALQKISASEYQVQLRGDAPGFLAFLKSLQVSGFAGQIQNLKMQRLNESEFAIDFRVYSRP